MVVNQFAQSRYPSQKSPMTPANQADQAGYLGSAPLVSVILVTYNHDEYVAQAMESIFAQKTLFDIEVLISEDCSTDGTRGIIQKFHEQNPGRVRLFLSHRNLNDNSVMTRAWQCARGRYIAILDGDDYWTDPHKLQRQVDFLEQHPETFLCGHAVNVIDETGKIINNSKFEIYQSRYITPEGLITDYGIPTLSMIFRNNKMIPASNIFCDVFNADTFMVAYFANFGGAYVMKQVMGTYRQHRKGVWTGLSAREVVDHSHKTFSRIPMILRSELKAIGYLVLLYHAVCKDYSWRRKLTVIPYAAIMLIIHIRYRSLKSISGIIFKKALELFKNDHLGAKLLKRMLLKRGSESAMPPSASLPQGYE